MNFLKKALAAGLTPANIICWIAIKSLFGLGEIWGTMGLKIKARLMGVKTGRNVRARGSVSLIRWPGGQIEIGDNVSFVSDWRRATACALNHPARLRVFGKGAKIAIAEGAQLSGVSITARSRTIKIGKQALIGPNCIIVDSDFHAHWPPESRADTPDYSRDAPVTIGDYAWLGMNCIILKGVTIGEGSIIGAGSVVSHDVPPNCVACGNPAKVVKYPG